MVNPILAGSRSISTTSKDLVGVLCVRSFRIDTLLIACVFLTAIELVITKAASNDFISLLLALIGISIVRFIQTLSLDLWRIIKFSRWWCDQGLGRHELCTFHHFLRIRQLFILL